MLSLLFNSPLDFLLLMLALVISITIHEFSHAFTADRLGDPTPRSQGRVTLNPLAHLDPLGSILLIITGFGWGKPVIFNPYHLKNLRRDVLLIALAGPISNIILATILAVLLPILPFSSAVWQLIITVNISLAAFNLLPIHPLDGGKVLSSLLPPDLAQEYDSIFQRYGIFILLLLVFPIFGNFSGVGLLVEPIMNALFTVIFAIAGGIHQIIGLR